MTTEHDVQSATLIDTSETGDALLFRNNCGLATYPGGQKVQYGVGNPGGSDLIGWRSVTVTIDMVGQRIAVFAALECKKPSRGVTSDDQKRFIKLVLDAGGYAGQVRSVGDAFRILRLPK